MTILGLIILTDQLPLKQGLKPANMIIPITAITLTDQLPLKQGLKLLLQYFLLAVPCPHRPTSIKTRIETACVQ